jgi:predicted RNA-binding protein YlqC (UPF0109 family)
MIKELVTFVVQQLVSRPHEIKVAADDRGRVIGKEGHTIKALRALVDTVASKDKRISLELSR